MKFSKIGLALSMLLGVQSVMVFSLGVRKKTAITTGSVTLAEKNRAVSGLKAYLNKDVTKRTQKDTENAGQDVSIAQKYQVQGGKLTAEEGRVVARVAGLPEVRVKLGAQELGRATLPVIYDKPLPAIPVTGVPKTTIGGEELGQIAGFIMSKDLSDQIKFWFGLSDLSSFFKGSAVNENMLMKAYNAIEPYRQRDQISVDDIYSIISKVLLGNKQSGLTLGQQTAVLAGMNRLFRQAPPIVSPAVLIPVESSDLTMAELEEMVSGPEKEEEKGLVYTIKPGESLPSVLKKLSDSLGDISAFDVEQKTFTPVAMNHIVALIKQYQLLTGSSKDTITRLIKSKLFGNSRSQFSDMDVFVTTDNILRAAGFVE